MHFIGCGLDNGGCEHACCEDKTDKWCSCYDGYNVQYKYRLEEMHVFQIFVFQTSMNAVVPWVLTMRKAYSCFNTIESYTCNCGAGFRLDMTSKPSCIGLS